VTDCVAVAVEGLLVPTEEDFVRRDVRSPGNQVSPGDDRGVFDAQPGASTEQHTRHAVRLRA
jgi:hypothetical protein